VIRWAKFIKLQGKFKMINMFSHIYSKLTALLLLSILLTMPLLVQSQEILKLEKEEEYSLNLEDKIEKYEFTLDFKLEKYTAITPGLEIDLGSAVLKIFACSGPKPKPGIYLYKGDDLIADNPLLVHVGHWYRLILHSDGITTTAEITALDDSIVGYVEIVPSLFIQGLAFDGEYWYYTATSMIFKVDKNGKIVDYNDYPIPKELREKGYFHLGDPEYHEGLLFIPVEKEGYVKPSIIAIYSAETLQLERYAYTQQDHLPWLTVDDKGRVYSSEFDPASEIYVYSLEEIGEGNELEPIDVIELDKPLRGVQGGAFYKGKLYFSVLDRKAYSVDPGKGVVEELIDLPVVHEMEGIEVYELEDGTLYHILVNTWGEENIVFHYRKIRSGETIKLFKVGEGTPIGPVVKIKAGTPLMIKEPKVGGIKTELLDPMLMYILGFILTAILVVLIIKKRKAPLQHLQ